VYGVVHALGPGHQKTLLAGYFLSEGGGVGRVALAAAATSILHATSVLAIFGGLALAARTFADTERTRALLTRGAGIALLILAVYIAVRRVSAAVRRLRSDPTDEEHGHHHHAEGESCEACERMERERARGASFWSVLLAGGVVPCPGAAFFLLFGVSAGNGAAGVLAVLAISAGMAVTLFIVAYAASAARGSC
jgi:ABC-type nickel/cobalt efflux system permease component RcnA